MNFIRLLANKNPVNSKKINRLVLCAGKVYFDLLETRRSEDLNNVAIVRIEQLYPFPTDQFRAEINKYPNLKECVWCQEEPLNQGAWYQSKHHLIDNLSENIKLSYAGREASASPAVGNFQVHIEQQKAVVQTALHAKPQGK